VRAFGLLSSLVSLFKYRLPHLRQSHFVVRLLSKALASRERIDGQVVIVCFHTSVVWWDGHLPDGTAGSEEAVVHIARQLSRLGRKVTVYNNCGARRRVSNVDYIPSWRYNPYSRADVTILWRSGDLLASPLASRRTYLWLHDLQSSELLPHHWLKRIDGVIFLSNYHRSTMPTVPADKEFISRNGIDLEDLSKAESAATVKRNTMRCIYASAPDRGLECLLKLWPSIVRRVPDATLCIFYGWKNWDFWAARDPSRYPLKARIMSLMDQPGILARNIRLDQQEIWTQFRQGGVWVYPTEFDETSCINAMKAQCAGAIPVVTETGALAETVQWGTIIKAKNIYTNSIAQGEFVDAVEQQLVAPDENQRGQMMRWAKAHFDWRPVAANWDRALLQ
jgi:glycosyltransferase involved in cell wall biosynthesis